MLWDFLKVYAKGKLQLNGSVPPMLSCFLRMPKSLLKLSRLFQFLMYEIRGRRTQRVFQPDRNDMRWPNYNGKPTDPIDGIFFFEQKFLECTSRRVTDQYIETEKMTEYHLWSRIYILT